MIALSSFGRRGTQAPFSSRGSKLARKGERGDTRDRRYLCVYCVYCVVLVLVHVHSYVLMTALAVARQDFLPCVGLNKL